MRLLSLALEKRPANLPRKEKPRPVSFTFTFKSVSQGNTLPVTSGGQGWHRGERGQAIVFVLLVLSLFLVAAVAFTVDIANLWFHRQMAQSAADAACSAGTMDLYMVAMNVSPPASETHWGSFTPGTAFDCSGASSAAPCRYAALNGYNGAGLVAGAASNDVYGSFPASVSGVTTPSGYASPFLRIDIVDRVRVFFIGLLSGSRTADVRAFAVCGLVVAQAATPILLLDPTRQALTMTGSGGIAIWGGPTRGIQVNANAANAVSLQGSGNIDLSKGGPSGTGSDLGVAGGVQKLGSGTTIYGATGHLDAGATPLGDPYAQLPAPISASLPAGAWHTVTSGVNGCPAASCREYTAGNYPSGINIAISAVLIFDPGVYYITGGMTLSGTVCVRPAIGAPDPMGIGGTMFYFADNQSIAITGSSGGCASFDTSQIKCPGGPQLPANVPANATGDVFLGPCSGTYGDPAGTGAQRGIVFFQNRSQSATPKLTGSGGLVTAGTMYFHQCVTSGADTGTGCSSSAYNTKLTMSGSGGSSTFAIGNTVADSLTVSGSGSINMDLSPASVYSILKAGLLR
jgi:hypothetical protein